jgi:hypothetical protein
MRLPQQRVECGGFKTQGTLLPTGPSTSRPYPFPETNKNGLIIAQSGIGKIFGSSNFNLIIYSDTSDVSV